MEPRYLRSVDVARLFSVRTGTVARWAATGRLTAIRTPGGRLRFREDEVRRLLDAPSSDGAA